MATNENAERCILKLFKSMAGVRPSGQANVCKDTVKRNVKDLRLRDKPNKKYKAMKSLTDMLDTCNLASIGIIVKHGVVSVCVELLKKEPNEDLQCASAYALQQIAAGGDQGQVKVVVDAGAVDVLTGMMQSASQPKKAVAVSALGTIAASEATPQNFDIYKQIVPVLVDLVKSSYTSQLTNTVGSLQNLFNAYIFILPEQGIRLCATMFANLLSMNDMGLVSHVCEALQSMCFLPARHIRLIFGQIIETGAVPRLVELLDSEDDRVITPCFQLVRDLVSSSALLTQHFIDSNILPRLANTLGSCKTEIVVHATKTIKLIADKCPSQLSEIVRIGMVPLLVNVVNKGILEARVQGVLALKFIVKGTEDHVNDLLNAHVFQAFCGMFDCKDTDAILQALFAIGATLKAAKKFGHDEIAETTLEECGGLDAIEELQNDPDYSVYRCAYTFIKNFFGEEEN